MSSTLKKVDYIFEEPVNLHINVDELFSLPLWIPGENRAKLKKNI